jgi:hypothetical protein
MAGRDRIGGDGGGSVMRAQDVAVDRFLERVVVALRELGGA